MTRPISQIASVEKEERFLNILKRQIKLMDVALVREIEAIAADELEQRLFDR